MVREDAGVLRELYLPYYYLRFVARTLTNLKFLCACIPFSGQYTRESLKHRGNEMYSRYLGVVALPDLGFAFGRIFEDRNLPSFGHTKEVRSGLSLEVTAIHHMIDGETAVLFERLWSRLDQEAIFGRLKADSAWNTVMLSTYWERLPQRWWSYLNNPQMRPFVQ